jgi:pimeloyl-ACP methyl ester carboxylesterase
LASEPRLEYVQCLNSRGLHRMAYWEWGDAANPNVLVCVHGLTRQGRDFDTLAQAMSATHRVICPDVVGRGHSERLPDAMAYGMPQYVADMVTLLARLNAGAVDWVGTSMGGVIGMLVASLKGSPLRRLVVNDIGPTIEPASMQRIGAYLGVPARWATLDEAADALWSVSQGFGPHTREQWLALSRPQLVQDAEGGYSPRYDPAIALPFKAVTPEMAAAGEVLLWQAWDSLRLPTLLLRGAQSDLLSAATAGAMGERGPRARCVEFAGVGHAPMLVQPDQVAVVREFLSTPP